MSAGDLPEVRNTERKTHSWVLAALPIACWYVLLFARELDLSTLDLGRHIANGQRLFEDSKVLTTNFYSYTFPEFPFINHHWGSGFVFYGIQQLLGFEGLSVFYIGLGLAALLLLIRETAKQHGNTLAIGTAL